MTNTTTEDLKKILPAYRNHKIVWAIKIGGVSIELIPHSAPRIMVSPHDKGVEPFQVSDHWYARSMLSIMREMGGSDTQCEESLVGGYFVVYEDDYQSWSPAETFENGHTRIETQL